MIEFTARDFDDLCRAGPVHEQIRSLAERRRAAVRHFWLYLLGSLLLAILVLVSLVSYAWPVAGIILAALVVVVGSILAFLPMRHAKADLKHPVLTTLGGKGGMTYIPDHFEPPAFPDAARILFGSISSYSFTDLFHGMDAHGQRFAIYEGKLTRRRGKNSTTLFSGQFYAFQRRAGGRGVTAIVPDRGIFNFLKPSGLSRVSFDDDPEFEKKFEVYSSDAPEAQTLLDGDVRRMLVELRRGGRITAHVGPKDVLVAIWGKNRFEPGSMFSARSGEERAKSMFDDVCASMDVMRTLKRALD